jgi:hypothetical protein
MIFAYLGPGMGIGAISLLIAITALVLFSFFTLFGTK